MLLDKDFFKGKNILITGHTGFVGSWVCRVLINFGAKITGYSLGTKKEYSLFELANIKNGIKHIVGDIRDFKHLNETFRLVMPEIVIHMAAQPIVREGYRNPIYTYETNVIGTLNILECCRINQCVKSLLNVTTDKVYKNNEWVWPYRENEHLDGYDPYSNSKSCSELITHCYKNSYFQNTDIAISTARAGNVIGGGDFAKNRLIPDCIRSIINNDTMEIRNPGSIRPYQHVLEAVIAYLMILEQQYKCDNYSGWYNVGPNESEYINTGTLVKLFANKWGEGFNWKTIHDENAPHESTNLKIDCSKIKGVFGWSPRWDIDKAVEKTVKWTIVWLNHGDVATELDHEIEEYLGDIQ